MKITTSDDGSIIIGEVFSGAYLETSEGNRIGFCMRDDTVEMNILPKSGGSQWIRIDMQDLCAYRMNSNIDGPQDNQTDSVHDGQELKV